MKIIRKDVLFKVWTDKPGWFVDEAYSRGLAISIIPDVFAVALKQNTSCEVKVIGLKNEVDDFITYVFENKYDVDILSEKEESH